MPHPSLAVKVLTWSREHPLVTIGPSLCVTVVGPHPSVAVAVPNAFSISPADGLHPRKFVVPPDCSSGGVKSSIHLADLDTVDVLPQPSLAVNVLI